MKFNDACIPLGGAWSSPFVRWQGGLAELNALDLAVDVTRRALARVEPARMPKAPVPAVRWKKMNPYGCSLVWGHPQGPTGLRAMIELIEALRERGGGTGLFSGCAAGDTGAAIVLRVED